MSIKSSWSVLPYVCIVAYLLYFFISVARCDEGMSQFYNVSYHVSREVRELRARLESVRTTLSTLLNSSSISFERIEKILDESNRLQDLSMDEIRKNFRDDPDGLLDDLARSAADLRRARLEVARVVKADTGKPEVMAAYSKAITGPMDRINDILYKIGDAADKKGAEIRNRFYERHRLSEMLAVLLALGFAAIFFYNQLRDKSQTSAIRHRESLFNLLSKNIDDVFFISDADGVFEYVSPNSGRILRLPAQEIKKSPAVVYELLGPEAGGWLRSILHGSGECDHRETDGLLEADKRALKIRVYPICVDGVMERHITVLSDQTREVEKQRALHDALASAESANVAKSHFLAHMSHEIRTPLNAVIGMTTIALGKLDDRARVEDCLRKTLDSSRHLLGLINDVLDMAKIEGGKMALNKEMFDLAGSLQSLINLTQAQATEHNLHFDAFIQGVEEENLYGDSLRLNQILVNLLSNAIKFTPAGGHVALTIEQARKNDKTIVLRFIVSDTGIGMSPEFLARLFTPFEQASPQMISKYGGTGLGLAITNNLVGLMGGAITVRSEVGKGARFTVELPFEYGMEDTRKENLPSLKVLVVDDDPGTCEHATELLKRIGMRAQWALTGGDAEDMIAEAHDSGEPFDVCLLDWKMADRSGAHVARDIRARFGNETMLIIMSAYNWSPIEDEARANGVNHFISKPFFYSTLYDAFRGISAEKGGEQSQENPKYDFTGKKVLLVEDNEFNREIALEFLEMVNADVDVAVNGREGMEKFAQAPDGHYDIVLMDIQMPEMNGYESARAIRALDRQDAATVPILAMTANAFTDDIAMAMDAGMNGHVAKPIDVMELYARMFEYIKQAGNHTRTA